MRGLCSLWPRASSINGRGTKDLVGSHSAALASATTSVLVPVYVRHSRILPFYFPKHRLPSGIWSRRRCPPGYHPCFSNTCNSGQIPRENFTASHDREAKSLDRTFSKTIPHSATSSLCACCRFPSRPLGLPLSAITPQRPGLELERYRRGPANNQNYAVNSNKAKRQNLLYNTPRRLQIPLGCGVGNPWRNGDPRAMEPAFPASRLQRVLFQ